MRSPPTGVLLQRMKKPRKMSGIGGLRRPEDASYHHHSRQDSDGEAVLGPDFEADGNVDRGHHLWCRMVPQLMPQEYNSTYLGKRSVRTTLGARITGLHHPVSWALLTSQSGRFWSSLHAYWLGSFRRHGRMEYQPYIIYENISRRCAFQCLEGTEKPRLQSVVAILKAFTT